MEEWTVYVTAGSPDEASEIAETTMWETSLPEFDIIDSEYYLDAGPIDPEHRVEPTRVDGLEGVVCAVCLTPAEWTGASADDPTNASGMTLLGPWRHFGHE